ncbi:FxsB family radical SAM/SPASM domain protein [Streptomyces sp. SID3343]|nr:FxsB family radical SAM/SPASM domain protein [Streptomyces sp. SID3343]
MRVIDVVPGQAPTFDSATAPVEPWPGRADPDDASVGRPFDQFVVKIHGRCNLACDYCYVYEMRDSGWRDRPRVMAAEVADRLIARIVEHVDRHRLGRVRVILHGGEPLLAGPEPIERFAAAIRHRLAAVGATAQLVVQSNGVLLDAALLDVLARYDIRVGLSLDGDRVAQDRHRRRADGRGTHADVARALALLELPRHRGRLEGLLCTVDLANEPRATCAALLAHRPPMIDFLLPHGTWDHPPPSGCGDGPYGRWLAAAFDHWWDAGRPVRVRLFDAVLDLWAGGAGGSEAVGLAAADAVVIETDGTYQRTDSLRAVADGATATGLDVWRHPLDAASALRALEQPTGGLDALCGICRSCPVVRVCGGGLRAHRHGRGKGFDNPSVYCRDLAILVGHVRFRMAERLSGRRASAVDGARVGEAREVVVGRSAAFD